MPMRKDLDTTYMRNSDERESFTVPFAKKENKNAGR